MILFVIEAPSPRLDEGDLARIADRLRQLRPLDSILDDIGDVIADQAPPTAEAPELAERLRGDLVRLENVAVAASDRDPQVASLVRQARTLRATNLPTTARPATVAHLRRLAGVAEALLERLAETGTLRACA
ncbi:DUF6415 family natural product biosynthesis protein [Streptomyces sp. NPDC058374]|uniref:DUF6415 family natural product biosynthesis protein n=1 Tax=unclassified Streptomyces TaxID=2593676 RepID=UPI003659DA2C